MQNPRWFGQAGHSIVWRAHQRPYGSIYCILLSRTCSALCRARSRQIEQVLADEGLLPQSADSGGHVWPRSDAELGSLLTKVEGLFAYSHPRVDGALMDRMPKRAMAPRRRGRNRVCRRRD